MRILQIINNKIIASKNNFFGIENYDKYRFGNYRYDFRTEAIKFLKFVIKKLIFYDARKKLLLKYENRLQKLYDLLNSNDQGILVDIVTFRLIGYKKLKLRNNNNNYWQTVKNANLIIDKSNSLTKYPNFNKVDLSIFNYNINLFYKCIGFIYIYVFEQYAKKYMGNNIVSVESGDVVFDIGAMVGDTSLYFASKVENQNGRIYSFEFTPSNIEIFNLNVSLNPDLSKLIELVERPVSDKSGDVIYFTDKGEGTEIKFEPFDNYEHKSTTISIDDFVSEKSIEKVDFIKMDIEGAESLALNGAIETIKRFKPKLAIAIYHSWDDFVNIPIWIENLNLGYTLYLDHYTIHTDETIIFAKVEN